MADWLPDRAQRHAVYLEALRATGVIPVVGNFKEKDRYCPNCGHRWIGHEEKETDVNIALGLLIGAYRDEYDRALVVSRDSDLAPAVRSVRALFPHKGITVVAPPHKGHSTELVLAAGRKTKIKLHHLEQCLLPDEMAVDGAIIRRPPTYAPPLQAVREPA